MKKASQIAEAFALAWEEGIYQGLSLCGGSLPGAADQDQYVAIARAVRDIREDWDGQAGGIPLDYLGGAPRREDLRKIDEIKDAGFRYIQFNLEIGDPAWFAAVCPGKARAIGYENWIHALEYSTGLFGKNGAVRSNLIAGIEPAETLIAANERLAGNGVLGVPNPWKPTPGSFLEGHRAPEPEWYIKFYDVLSDMFIRSPFDLRKILETNPPRFFEYSPAFHFWRAKLGITTRDQWRQHTARRHTGKKTTVSVS
jgi:hypothetical protein